MKLDGSIHRHVNLDHFVVLSDIELRRRTPSRIDSFDFSRRFKRARTPSFLDLYRKDISYNLERAVASLRDNEHRNVSIALVSPSIIPNYNPSFRIYELGPSERFGNIVLQDYVQYTLDLPELNKCTEDGNSTELVTYVPVYRASEDLNMRDLSPNSFMQLSRELIDQTGNDTATRIQRNFWRNFEVQTHASKHSNLN
jgi:hypothetical protein